MEIQEENGKSDPFKNKLQKYFLFLLRKSPDYNQTQLDYIFLSHSLLRAV